MRDLPPLSFFCRSKALLLEFLDTGAHLGNGGGDVGKLDDIGVGRLGEFAQLGEGIRQVCKIGKDTTSKGDVARFDGDSGSSGKVLNNGKQ